MCVRVRLYMCVYSSMLIWLSVTLNNILVLPCSDKECLECDLNGLKWFYSAVSERCDVYRHYSVFFLQMLFIELLAVRGHWVAALHLKLNVYHHRGKQKFSFIMYKTDLTLKLLFVFAKSEQLISKIVFGNHCTSFAVSSTCSWVWCWHLNSGQMWVTSTRQTFLHPWALILIPRQCSLCKNSHNKPLP